VAPTFETKHPLIAGIENVIGHVIAIVAGFMMMIVGLALSVTMVMLPVGIIIGLFGAAVFVGGCFAHVDDTA
jgi:hypothetical protein